MASLGLCDSETPLRHVTFGRAAGRTSLGCSDRGEDDTLGTVEVELCLLD